MLQTTAYCLFIQQHERMFVRFDPTRQDEIKDAAAVNLDIPTIEPLNDIDFIVTSEGNKWLSMITSVLVVVIIIIGTIFLCKFHFHRRNEFINGVELRQGRKDSPTFLIY